MGSFPKAGQGSKVIKWLPDLGVGPNGEAAEAAVYKAKEPLEPIKGQWTAGKIADSYSEHPDMLLNTKCVLLLGRQNDASGVGAKPFAPQVEQLSTLYMGSWIREIRRR